MELTVQNVYGLLLRSRLLPLDEAKAAFARWNEQARENAGDVVRFTSWLVGNKHLTEYQAQLLARGHADGFFLGDYKILDRLGKGRMAGVYKAQHKLGQVVAIKVLPPSKAREPVMLSRFQRESKLALRLKHPNVVRAFQVGRTPELHYLVMEYLEGETLEDVLAVRKKMPPAEAVRLAFQALEGLQHIHEQGLVHRDLKPANLMLVPSPGAGTTLRATVKILDIGLGRIMDEGMENADPGLTGEGVLLGTPDYMAPEQARDARAIDIRADIYSVGCVLYHLLAGQPPFPDTNIISQMIRHASEPPRPLAAFNPDVPDGLQQIVNWMMAKSPDARYPTPARAASALEVFLAAGSAPASGPDLDPGMKPFMEWLEKEKKKAPPSSSAMPAALVPTMPSVSLPPPPGKAARRARKEERRKSKPDDKPPPPPPSAEPRKPVPAPPSKLLDVELVPGPEDQPWTKLGRRDIVFFVGGAFAAVLAWLLGRGLAALLSRRPPEPEEAKE